MGIFLSELNTYYKTFFKTSNVWLVRRHNVQRWFTHASLTPLHSSHATSQQCRQEAHVINLSASDLCVHTPSTKNMLDG